jgi:type I restriction enzyme S subunit
MLDIEVFEGGFKETELGPLPEEWEVVRLGEVVEKMKAGGTPRRSEKRFWGGSIPFIMIEDLTKSNLYIKDAREYITEEGLKNSNAWIVPPNSLLLSMYATIGETAINLIPVATNQAILGIIPKKDRLNVEFGAYLLKFHAKRLLFQNIQTTQKNINKGIVENFLIPLPPLEEQKAIAGILSTVQSAIEKTEKVINALKNLKKSMMRHLFTYGPVAEEEAEKVELKETEIGLIPKHWEVVRLGEVAEIKSGGTPSRNVKKYWENGTIPWIKSEKCQDCFIYEPSEYITEEGLKNSSAKIFKPHTVLIAMVGATAGKTGYLMIEACTNQNVAGLIQKIENLNSLYLFYCLQYRYSDFVKEKQGDYKIANLSFIKAFPIPLPPIEEQQKIAQILQSIDQRIEKDEKYKNALQNLFKSLLHNLMTGKIRVRVKNHGED